MRKEDFQNTKIRVRNEAESQEFQEAMFKLGFRWFHKGDKVSFTKVEFLFTDEEYMTYSHNEETFKEGLNKEITMESIRNNMKAKLTKEVAEKMYKSEDESVRAFALSNYPDLEAIMVWNPEEEKMESASLFIHPEEYYPTKELYEASKALIVLLQERNRYNGNWVANWEDYSDKYIIGFYNDKIHTDSYMSRQTPMYFKTAKLRNKFLENFRDLLEIAKPLL